MCRILVSALSFIAVVSFMGCDNNPSAPPPADTVTYATDTAIVDYKNENNVVYFDFSTGTKTTVSHHIWDIAFDANRFIIANGGDYGYGVLVCSTGVTDITQDFSSWEDSLDLDTDTGHFTLTTLEHNVLGTNYKTGSGMSSTYTENVYVIRTEDLKFYKLQITGSLRGGAGLRMKIDSLSGTGAVEDTFPTTTIYDYTYVDLGAKSQVDVAPPKSDWDIKFGRRGDFIMSSMTSGRSSIVLNTKGGVEVATVDSAQLDEVTTTSGLTFNDEMLAIDHDWYSYDRSSKTYVINPAVYVIKTTEDKYAKIKILSFKGPDGESFWSVFDYYYQEDGSATFSK